MRPKVDVGVVTWNTADLTVDCLRHLLDSDQGCDLRVLVHDNGSTDGTVERIIERVPEAEVEACGRNLGFAAGVNRLLHRSRSPWFLALNSDAWPEPGAVGTLVQTAEDNPGAAAVAPLLLRPDGGTEHSTHPFPSVGVAVVDLFRGRHWMPTRILDSMCLEGGWNHDRPRAVDWAVGAALLLRRSAVEEIGVLDERFFMYVEDLEWCWRAQTCGWEVRFEPGAAIRHVGNASGEKRWGDQRANLQAAYLSLLLPEMMGSKRARTYRYVRALGCLERMIAARIRGAENEAGQWRLELKGHLGLAVPPHLDTPQDDGVGSGADRGVPDADEYAGPHPKVSVVVPTCGRSENLVRLVSALEAQTMSPAEFEVVMVDDGSPDNTAEVLEKIFSDTSLQLEVIVSPLRRGPAAARNLGWRAAKGPVVAFTDDDCVPSPQWLKAGAAAFAEGARIVVGRTAPPDDQLWLLDEPFSRSVEVESARLFETCNAFYLKRDLQAVGGFDERFRFPSGEDTNLGLTLRDLGVDAVFAPEALVHHDVRPGDLTAAIRETFRWTDLPLVLKGRPRARLELAHRWIFWKPTHPPAILAAVGLLVATRRLTWLALVIPWLYHRISKSPVSDDPVKNLRALPGALALDLSEVAVMIRGSIRHETFLL